MRFVSRPLLCTRESEYIYWNVCLSNEPLASLRMLSRPITWESNIKTVKLMRQSSKEMLLLIIFISSNSWIISFFYWKTTALSGYMDSEYTLYTIHLINKIIIYISSIRTRIFRKRLFKKILSLHISFYVSIINVYNSTF